MDSRHSTLSPTTRPRLGGIIDSYMRRKLPRNTHPALHALRDHREIVNTPDQIPPSGTERAPCPQPEVEEAESEVEESEVVVLETEHPEVESNVSFEELYKDTESEKQRFEAAVEAYEKATQGSTYKTGIQLNSTHTWEEVLEKIDAASASYNDGTGRWGKIRRSLHAFGKTGQVFEAWADLLPSQSQYFSILCGGLKLIFGAASRLQDLRDDISEALAEIPYLLSRTQRAMGAFRKSEDLRHCSANLYVSTLSALNHIVVWYREKAHKKMFKSFFKQNLYEQQLTDKIETIRVCSRRFEDSARLCLYETATNTNQAFTAFHSEWLEDQQNMKGELNYSRIESSRNYQKLGNTLMSGGEEIQRTMGVMSNRIKSLELVLTNFLSSNERIDYSTEDVKEPSTYLRKTSSESKLITERSECQQALLSDMDYEHTVLKQDKDAKLRTVWTLPRQEQDRIFAIMRSPKLQNWLTTETSTALFINGNSQASKWQQATSFVSAKLVDSINPSTEDERAHSSTMISLAFFCGEHLQQDDPGSMVDGMMRSLLAQLLLAWPNFDLKTIREMRDGRFDDLQDLCDMFCALIGQLSSEVVVFCVMDAIGYYENSKDLCEEASFVIETLTDLVERTTDGGCTFKLLLMCSWNSRKLSQSMVDPQEEVLWMPTGIPSVGGFTLSNWNAIMQA